MLTALKNHVHIPAPAIGPAKEKTTATLDLLTLNTWLRPSPIGQDRVERSVRIGASVTHYPIVGLQETFSDDSEWIGLTARLQGSHPHGWRQARGGFLTSNSGLTTLSKYPVVTKDFQPFAFSTGSDSLARKGVTFTRLDVPGIGYVDVYNTHYQAGTDVAPSLPLPFSPFSGLDSWLQANLSKQGVRLKQNQQVADFVQKHDQGYPTFVLGDFNMHENSPEYKDLMARLGVKDAFREANPTDPGYTSDPTRNPHGDDADPRERLDYIFYKPGKEIDVKAEAADLTHTAPIEGLFVSDHFGVHARFRFDRK